MDTIASIIATAAGRYGNAPALQHRTPTGWAQVTYTELDTITGELGRGLIELGVAPGDRVCILSETRPEWTYVDFALLRAGAAVVPIYPSSSPEECAWVIGNSGARFVVCEDAAQVAKIDKVRERLPELEAVLVIDPTGTTALSSLEDLRVSGRSAGGEELARRTAAVGPDDTWSVVYTSGTTGPAKGCVITHRNMRFTLATVEDHGLLTGQDRAFLFLPLAHMFARVIQLHAVEVGACVIYFGGDLTQILAELAETRPTFLPSVPRVFEKIHAKALAHAREAGGAKLKVFSWAVEVGREVARGQESGTPPSLALRAKYAIADRLVFAKVRDVFGGEVRTVLTGAAPIAPEILEFFYGAGITVVEGYGMTETTAVISVTPPGRPRFGTVGTAVPGVEISIAEDGEVLTRGQNVFAGYHHDPEATAATIVDGWLHTGDLGELDADGYLTITGRKKDIIITAGGKNLSPANLENDLQRSRWISRAFMHGDRRPYPVALITLDPEEITAYASEHGLPAGLGELAAHPAVHQLIQTDLDGVNARYAKVSQIKRFVVLDHDLTQEAGHLTPTLKVKRSAVEKQYAAVLDRLYAE